MGDTCHHYKGDTWHRMMSTGDWTGMVVGNMEGDMDHTTFYTFQFLVGG
jgi:hypothetical protein